MLIPAQISGWMMINVVAILAYLIIHINILIFAVGRQIFIELSPILSLPHMPTLWRSVWAVCGQHCIYTEENSWPLYKRKVGRSYYLQTLLLCLWNWDRGRWRGFSLKCIHWCEWGESVCEYTPTPGIRCGHYQAESGHHHQEENYSRWYQDHQTVTHKQL